MLEKKYLTVKEVEAVYSLKYQKLLTLRKKGRIEAKKIGKNLYFSVKDLDNLFKLREYASR